MTTAERQSTHRLRAVGGLLALTALATACSGWSSPSSISSSTAAAPSTTVAVGPTAAQAALVAARPFDVHVPPGQVPSTSLHG